MNTSLFIARRYLFSKKSRNAINIISGISAAGVAVGVMALIVVLSVFNGFDTVVKSLFNAFDPELRITAAKGKVFIPDSAFVQYLTINPNIVAYSETLEENALLEYSGKQFVATIKGVSESYQLTTGVDSMMVDGTFKLKSPTQWFAVPGYGVAQQLGVGLHFVNPITFYVPSRTSGHTLNPADAFNIKRIYPTGIFSIQDEFDSKYVFVPLEFTQELLEYRTERTAIEIKTTPGLSKSKLDNLQEELAKILGDNYRVQNRYQQHELMYKIMKSEKWVIFIILTFIIIIAAFNVVGSLTMLILDKKKDIRILQSMGGSVKLIRRIFVTEGFLIIFLGSIIGLALGLLICWLQITFKIISFPGSGIMSSYPVDIRFVDIPVIFFTVNIAGYLISRIPVGYITRKHLD